MKRLFIFISVLNYFYSFSCSCEYTQGLSSVQIQSSDFIFIGKIKKVEKIMMENEDGFWYLLKTTFDIKKDYKFDNKEITVFTEVQESACGLSINSIGDEWLIFAYLNNGQIETNQCTKSTKLINKKYKEYTEILDKYFNTEGLYEVYDSKQRIIEKGNLKNREPVGLWYFYKYDHRFGKYLDKQVKYDKGKFHSIISYHSPLSIIFNDSNVKSDEIENKQDFGIENKRVQSKQFFIGEVREEYYYHENGNLSSKSRYKNNKKDGIFCYYFENGLPSYIYSYKDDIKTNYYTHFYDNGNIQIQGNFEDNKPVGEWKAYTRDGKLALICYDKIPTYSNIENMFICP